MSSLGGVGVSVVTRDRFLVFFFDDAATTEIYTLSLHDALPISCCGDVGDGPFARAGAVRANGDRKSTRLNSSHRCISYAVFCLKKKMWRRSCSGTSPA